MLLSDFDFHLPVDSIAQAPLEDRAGSRMLVVHRAEGRWEDRMFRDLPEYLGEGDCLVVNDSRVIPARLYGHRAGFTGQVEALLVRPESEDGLTWLALMRPGRKLRTGDGVEFGEGLRATILGRNEHGERMLRFEAEGDFWERLEALGHVPLPPYIHRPDSAADRERYQTVYAGERGSVAAPTAGLHFTPEVLERCRAAGARVARVTLHVGLGTFQPLHAAEIEKVKLHAERFHVSAGAVAEMEAARRVVAVGTTAMRTVESQARGMAEETSLFISPGFEFRRAGAMLTNFHLPQSSLLVLVCAFAGRELTLGAYEHAVRAGYRFYSYGDCMLVV
ncbi:MAG: tRNA preQ1(34) S-adenosylmethionine ribosyltransferase-isomerase QueA [Acidobacteria bacterium]|nr:tRNA preQ1(34) S-adenosylmethionine ribosyltransferase-isomerase QueA [Acidobacteriota bacterium]